MDKVNEWRSTLTNVADFSGKPISQQRSEADTIDEIVDVILKKINPKTLHVAKYPVGLNSLVKDITTLLRSGSKEGVIKFGIYGMGGLGKTTLAKALYNQLLLESFKDCCFLANVREISGTLNGLESLQHQLINDILKSKTKIEVHNVDKGTELIRARLCSTKVLVVIDDVDDRTRFESLIGPFAPGSLVIITTRDKELLDTIEVEAGYQYNVKELDENESLNLFNQHAFGNAKADESFMVFSRDILDYAGGLPLALEVFGSSLYKQPVVGWKSFIEKLQRIPNSTIQQRLKISFDVLDDPMLKELFLDIACVFIGYEKEWVVQKMESYYPFVDHNIDLLQNRCLLMIDHDKKLTMHDMIRDMGRDIVCNNYPKEPEIHSRLFIPEDILEVLKNNKGTKAIEVIYLRKFEGQKDCLEGASLTVEAFKHMSKLRFLYLESEVNITGSFENTIEDLRWLYWKDCPLKHLPSRFCPKKLVILELPHSRMTTMQEPHMFPDVFVELKTLNMLGSQDLPYSEMITIWEPHMVPEVFENLRILNMSDSLDLSASPDFSNMPCLETLDLRGCESMDELHISIGSLTRLVSLNLCGCKKLRSLPDSICNLGALESLNIDSCSTLEALPLKMGDIKSLMKFNCSNLTVLKLPDSIGRLRKLVHLKLSENWKLETLPDSICNLRALEVLDISGCHRLKMLPAELGNIVSLKTLKAEGLHVWNLPDSIGHLSQLVHLNIANTILETLPDSFCNLRTLEVLDIHGCCNLQTLPIELGNVESLKELHAYDGDISRLPDSIGHLSKLVHLNLSFNMNLETLPDSFCNLRSLEVLNMSYCRSLKTLPIELGNIESLKELQVYGINISRLPDSVSRLSRIVRLNLGGNKNLEILPYFICSMKSLETLGLRDCERLLFITELPPNLKHLLASNCRSMERLPNLSKFEYLKTLDLSFCSGLIEIVGWEELTSLRQLSLFGCKLSCVKNSLTKSLIQIYSEFGCQILISTDEPAFPEWISTASLGGSIVQDIDLPLNLLGIILCSETRKNSFTYTLKNTAREIIWNRNVSILRNDNCFAMVILPRSTLLLTEKDRMIEVTVKDDGASIHGVHLLYKD